MSERQNWNDIGNQIRDAVQGALKTGDFKEMNQIISESVNKALAETKKQAGQAMEEVIKQSGQATAKRERVRGQGRGGRQQS